MFPLKLPLTLMALILAILAIPGILSFIGDRRYGRFTGTDEIRGAARLFRSEAGPFGLHASSMVLNVEHVYADGNRSDSSRLFFRTGPDGTILGPKLVADAEETILSLGGSTTESNEVSEAARFPAVVQQLLRSAKASVGTLNAGVRGHTTQDSIISYLARPGFG